MVEDLSKNNFYISQRAANNIIADITPYRISPEALSVINNFLDEFLYLLVDSSRSLCLENIKPAIFHVLPTNLGKNSIKEAELELKTYMESEKFDKTLEKNVELFDPYPVQKVFEQFRIECKSHSTLSEQSFSINDRDPSTMPGLHNCEGIYISPSLAVYMMAVLEYIGQHILILVAKALKQQGDATVAKANEVYLALTDNQILTVFQRTNLKEKMEETLSIQPKSPDSNLTLSPLSPKTPLSENATGCNTMFMSPETMSPNNPTQGGNIMFRSPEVTSPSCKTNGDTIMVQSPEAISPSNPTKDDDIMSRSPEAISSSNLTKDDDIMSRSPEAISPSSPTKDDDIMSQSPEAISPNSPTKQDLHNEVGVGSRKTSTDDVLWSKSPTSPNRTINDNERTSIESKNSRTHSERSKFKDRDIKSISSLDDIDKMISFEHLISTNQNLTLKVSLTSNRMKTIETQKREPRKFEPREPVARERLIPSKSQENEEDDDDDLEEFLGGKKKPKESLFEFLKNTDPDDIFNKSTGKLRRKDSKVDLLQKRIFNNKPGSTLERATSNPTNSVKPRHIPLIPSGRLSTSSVTIPSNNTSTLHHSKSLDNLSSAYRNRSIANKDTDKLYNRQKSKTDPLDFDDDYDIINFEKLPKRFDTQDLIDFLNTSSPPNDKFVEKKKERKFTKLLSKLRIPSKGKYENGTRLSNTSTKKPKYVKIQIPEILPKEETHDNTNTIVKETYDNNNTNAIVKETHDNNSIVSDATETNNTNAIVKETHDNNSIVSDTTETAILPPQDDNFKHDDDVNKSEQYKQQIISITVDNFLQEIIFMESIFEESDDESEQKLTSEVNEDEMDDILAVEWLLCGVN